MFVVGDDGVSFEPRNVVVGIRDNHFVEIRSGLEKGETVITDGYQVLEPGDRIAIKKEPKPGSTSKEDTDQELVASTIKQASFDKSTDDNEQNESQE